MKYILTSLFLGLFFAICAQKPYDEKNLPFQVIIAENVENNQGKQINSLDLIPIDDIVTIRQGGFLAMINYFGLPIEIESDTTIIIKELQKAFDLLDGSKTGKVNHSRRPDISYLFIADGDLARKHRLAMTGGCSDCDFDLELIYPPKNGNDIFFSGDLCLRWHSTGSNNYVIKLTNVFDEQIETYASATNELKIDSAEITAMINREEALMLYIKDATTNKTSMNGVIKKFPSNTVTFPYECASQQATYALITAFFLEIGPRDFPKSAGAYYRLAAELSDKKFFKTMLENFNERRE
jgi:hypothetical protein